MGRLDPPRRSRGRVHTFLSPSEGSRGGPRRWNGGPRGVPFWIQIRLKIINKCWTYVYF